MILRSLLTVLVISLMGSIYWFEMNEAYDLGNKVGHAEEILMNANGCQLYHNGIRVK